VFSRSRTLPLTESVRTVPNCYGCTPPIPNNQQDFPHFHAVLELHGNDILLTISLMEFREFAATETSGLISRLLGRRSEESLQQLRTVREALDAAEQALEASPKVDKEIRDFVGRIVNAAGAAIKHVREESKAALDAVRGELAGERAEREKLAASLSELQEKADDVTAKLLEERERAGTAERDLVAARDAYTEMEAARQKAEELLDAANAETATLSNQLIEETATAFSLRSELAGLQQGLEAANAKAKEAAAQHAAAKAAVERQQKELAAQVAEARAAAEREIKERTAQQAKAREAAERELREAAEQQIAAVKAAAEREIKETTAEHAKARAAAERDLKHVAEQLAAVKAAAEREIHEIRESASKHVEARAAAEREVNELIEQLTEMGEAREAAERELQDARGKTAREISELTEQLTEMGEAREAAERELQDARGKTAREISELTEQLTEMGEAREAADRELQDVRGKLEAALADVGRLGAQLEASASERSRLLTSLSAAQGELGTAQEQREGLAAQLRASQARAQALERAESQRNEQVKQLEAKLNETKHAEAALKTQAATHQKEFAGRQAEMASLGEEAERARAVFDACLRGAGELAAATTVTGLLAALVKQLATQFSRVAVFRLKGNRLEGEHQVGFDQTKDVTKLIIPLTMDSMITRVATTGAVESLVGKEATNAAGTPLGGTPSTAVSLPVVFHGQTIAVVYADDSGQKAAAHGPVGSDSRVGFARVMLGQTGVLLLRLTHELKTIADLREYATQLIQEAAQMHAADATAGRNAEEVRRRLKGTMDWARQLFGERVTLAGGLGTAVLEEQIAVNIEKQATPFARDLAAVVGRARGSQRAAEAS
jgi:chromosome segregation ATPase